MIAPLMVLPAVAPLIAPDSERVETPLIALLLIMIPLIVLVAVAPEIAPDSVSVETLLIA